jgi:hypothetical protein
MLPELEADRARIAELKAQILLLERSLSAMRSEKALPQERLNSYKYPVLTLPNEIISEIFIHFLPIYPLCPPFTGILSPTLLTQICRHWREIGLATPALWRAISLVSHDDDSPVERHVQNSLIWLRRSRGCPVSIEIDYEERYTPEVLAAVVLHRARWEHIELYLSPSNLPIIVGPMPLLRHLHLSLDDPPLAPSAVAFAQAPQLRTVILEAYATSNLILPWKQFTSLTLNEVHRSEYVRILRQTPNLRQCVLDILVENADTTGPQDIDLPCLESLTLDVSSHLWTFAMYPDFFVVPALRSLRIPESFLGTRPIDALTSFISKSGSNLKQLHITGERSHSRHSYRNAFPTILEFYFDDYPSVDNSDSDSSESDVANNSQ